MKRYVAAIALTFFLAASTIASALEKKIEACIPVPQGQDVMYALKGPQTEYVITFTDNPGECGDAHVYRVGSSIDDLAVESCYRPRGAAYLVVDDDGVRKELEIVPNGHTRGKGLPNGSVISPKPEEPGDDVSDAEYDKWTEENPPYKGSQELEVTYAKYPGGMSIGPQPKTHKPQKQEGRLIWCSGCQ